MPPFCRKRCEMQIRNVFWYVLNKPLGSASDIAQQLQKHAFQPCMSTQEHSQGWVAPGPFDEFVYEAHGAMLFNLKHEKRLLPSAVVNEYLAEKVEAFELAEGYAPSRKIRQQMKEDLTLELLPKAFTKSSTVPILVFPKQGWLFVLGASAKTADDATAFLRETLGSLPITLLNTETSPAFTMTQWLQSPAELPADWALGEEAELVDEDKATVRIKNQSLYSDELHTHLDVGKRVSKLALLWRDEVSLILQDDLSIKRIKPLLENDDFDQSEGEAARFSHEFAVSCQWWVALCHALLEALGGLDKALQTSQSRAFK